MQIFLIGFMGSGKSTLGKLLAKELNYDFVDSDAAIERLEGIAIAQIFEQKGETYFRSCEKAFVTQLNSSSHTIVSCGGGLPCFNDLMPELKKKGKVIYLKLSVDQLVERLKNEIDNRPILVGLDELGLHRRIQDQLSLRSVIYEEADIVINMDEFTIEESLGKLKRAFLSF